MARHGHQPQPRGAIAAIQPLWTAAAVAVVVLTVLFAFIAPARATDIPPALTAGLVLAIVVASAVGAAAVERVLAATRPPDDEAALAQYRTSSLLTLAVVLLPAPLTGVAALVLGPNWIVWIGGIGVMVLLGVTRPSLGRIRRLDAAWRAAGHDISIERAASR